MGKGSNRFIDAMRQTEGGDIDVILLKKLKTCIKRLNLPKKLLMIAIQLTLHLFRENYAQKRRNEYVSQSSPRLTNRIHKFKWPLQDCNKKLKVYSDEQQHYSKRAASILEKISKNEEQAIAGLLALVELYPGDNKTEEMNLNNEVSEASKPEDLVKNGVQIDVKKDSEDVTDGNNSRKRCSSHVYICQIIKDLQIKEDKKLNSLREPKTDVSPENITNGNNAGINLDEASTISKTLFQDQARASGVQAYFGNPFCDPSQWSRPMISKQQMWMNPFIPGAASYQNWQNGGREKILPLSGSYVEASLQNVLVSTQQVSFRMQLGHCCSGSLKRMGVFLLFLEVTAIG